jgi:hypothetical protein
LFIQLIEESCAVLDNPNYTTDNLYFSKILEVLTIFKVSDFPVYNAIKSGRHLINPETGIFYKITKIY